MEDSWLFTYNNIDNIKQIRVPLDRLGVKFCYERILKDGRFFVLISHYSDFYHSCRDHNFFDQKASKFYMAEVFSTLKNHQKKLFWPIELYHRKTQEFFEYYNIGRGLSFFHNDGESVESWSFISDKTPKEANLFLLAHHQVLEQFIHYFNYHTHTLKDYNANKLILPKLHNDLIMWNDFQCNEDNNTQTFLQAIQNKNRKLLISPNKTAELTKREVECLYHLSRGQTYKEIACNMKISHKTVETHMKKIKTKTSLTPRSKLVKMFLDNNY